MLSQKETGGSEIRGNVRSSIKAGRKVSSVFRSKKKPKKKKKGLIKTLLSLVVVILLFLILLLVLSISSVFVFNMQNGEESISYKELLMNEFSEFKEIISDLTEDEYQEAMTDSEEYIEEAVSATLSDERNQGLTKEEKEKLEALVRESSNIIAPVEQVTDADVIKILAAFQLSEQLKLSEQIEAKEVSFPYVAEDLTENMRQNLIDLKGLVLNNDKEKLYVATENAFTYSHMLSSEYLSDENAYQLVVLARTEINSQNQRIEYIYESGPYVCTDFVTREAKEPTEVGVYEMMTHKVIGNNSEPTEKEYMTKVGTKTIYPKEVYVTGVTVTISGLSETLFGETIENIFSPIKLSEVPKGYIDSTGEEILNGMCNTMSKMLFGISYDELIMQSKVTFNGSINPKVYRILKECLDKYLDEDITSVRKQVLYKGLQLVDKVPYFWGGKYPFVGFCEEWNQMKVVSAAGSKTTGTIRPYGLDCSGFVQWAFINAIDDPIKDTYDFWASCEEIEIEDLLPGDLAFYWRVNESGYMDWDHVLIFAGYNENEDPMWLHCGAAEGIVALDTPWYADHTSPAYIPSNMTYGRLTTIDYEAKLKTQDPADRITADGYYETWQGIGLGEFYWPVDSYLLSSLFGPRIHPITGEYKNHNGIDFCADYGQPIYSCMDGVVLEADGGGNWNGGWGNYVMVEHENGLVTIYSHCSNVYVTAGDKVKEGDKIASIGSTGMSTGPHLHLEVINDGVKVDPELYL